jgi:hypothetical protein
VGTGWRLCGLQYDLQRKEEEGPVSWASSAFKPRAPPHPAPLAPRRGPPGVLNALLARDAAARRRSIALRTYAVIPLADDCGILQWVDNLVAFKVGGGGARGVGGGGGRPRVGRVEWRLACARERTTDSPVCPTQPPKVCLRGGVHR